MTQVSSVTESRELGVFVGCDQGVWRLKPGERVLRDWLGEYEIPRFHALCVFRDSQDRVWLGGEGSGLYRVDGEKLSHFQVDTDGMASDDVYAVWEDEGGETWIGGAGGLSRINANDEVVAFRREYEFLSQPILAIVGDDQDWIWFGTPRGIYGVAKDGFDEVILGKRNELEAIHLTRDSGLENESVEGKRFPAAIKAPDGKLWFCMDRSLAVFDPEEVVLRGSSRPKVVIESIGNGNTLYLCQKEIEEAKGGSPILLPLQARSTLNIDYSAITYTTPKKIRFEYRWGGPEKEWTKARQQRYAILSGSGPGDHSFEVRAIGHNGLPTAEPEMLQLRFPKYYYETWAFRFGVLGVIGALAEGFHRWRVTYLRRIQNLERLQALTDERLRIARDMHDEFGASLARVVLRGGNDLEENEGDDGRGRVSEELKGFAVESLRSLREVIWSLNSDKDSFEDVGDYLEALVTNYFEGTGVEVEFELKRSSVAPLVTPSLKRDLVKFVKGIISNVVRHAQATRFCFAFMVNQTHLTMTAADDGCGFDPESLRPDSFGLQSLRERASIMGGVLRIRSKLGEGTEIEIQLPILNLH